MTESTDKKLAKRLALLVAEQGESAVAEIKPALEKILEGRSNAERRRFLKAFNVFLKREIHKDTLVIETAGEASAELVESLTKSFQSDHPRPLQVQTAQEPELIAGVRVRLGDNVFDASIKGKLAALAASIH